MNLTVYDPSSVSMGTCLGIPENRIDTLLSMMDEELKKYDEEDTHFANQGTLLSRIAKHCNTEEELVFCTISNTITLIRVGRLSVIPLK